MSGRRSDEMLGIALRTIQALAGDEMGLTRAQLADAVGVSRDSVERLLRAMRDAGWPVETHKVGAQMERVRLAHVARDAQGQAYLRLTAAERDAVAKAG